MNRLSVPFVRARGFTLVELMVVVAVTVMLLLVGVPLAVDWVDGARTRESRSKLEQAYGMAKALATRNPCGARGSGAESAQLNVAVQDTQATISVALPGDSSNCGFLASRPNPQWVAQLPSGLSVSINSQQASKDVPLKLSLDNRGLPSTGTQFLIRKGSTANDQSGNLY